MGVGEALHQWRHLSANPFGEPLEFSYLELCMVGHVLRRKQRKEPLVWVVPKGVANALVRQPWQAKLARVVLADRSGPNARRPAFRPPVVGDVKRMA